VKSCAGLFGQNIWQLHAPPTHIYKSCATPPASGHPLALVQLTYMLTGLIGCAMSKLHIPVIMFNRHASAASYSEFTVVLMLTRVQLVVDPSRFAVGSRCLAIAGV
jgi:hypothetical protein